MIFFVWYKNVLPLSTMRVFYLPGNSPPNVNNLITSLSSISIQSVTSSTTTMVNSLPQPSPPAVSSQPPVDTTNSDLPPPPISPAGHSTSTSAIITSPFAGTVLSSPASTTVSSTVVSSSPLFTKVNVTNSLVDTPASHGPLIMSAQPQSEVGLFMLVLCLP